MKTDERTFINQSAADTDEVLVAKINTANVELAAATAAYGRDSEQAESESRRLGVLMVEAKKRYHCSMDLEALLRRVDWKPLLGEKKRLVELTGTPENLQENLEFALKDAFATFFKENPEVKALAWVQYTDYDEFHPDNSWFWVGELCSLETAEHLEDLRNDKFDIIEFGSLVELDQLPDQPRPADFEEAALTRAVSKIPVQVFRAMFGDGVKVIATADGFEVLPYDKDMRYDEI
jgi:hypothetical protein